jgi:hypothetical protein
MKIRTLLLGTLGVFATGILVERVRQHRASRLGAAGSDTMGVAPVFDAEIVGVGISSVDPEPLAQTAGEGIDLDANAAAHRRTP